MASKQTETYAVSSNTSDEVRFRRSQYPQRQIRKIGLHRYFPFITDAFLVCLAMRSSFLPVPLTAPVLLVHLFPTI